MTQLHLSLAYTTGADNRSLPPLYLTGITPYYILNFIPIPQTGITTPLIKKASLKEMEIHIGCSTDGAQGAQTSQLL